MSKFILYFDGRCTGNGTPAARAGYGYVIEDADGEELASGCGMAGEGEGVTGARGGIRGPAGRPAGIH